MRNENFGYRWPSGTSCALCLTFDLDAETMWTSIDGDNARRPSVISQGRYDVGAGLELVLELLESNGLNTTFFVPSSTADKHPDAVREIAKRGHEVANHGTDHESIDGITMEAERKMVQESQRVLARVVGSAPEGYRAPLFQVNEHTIDILAEEGVKYSSNMMDSFHPYRYSDTGGGLVEIPVHYMLDDGSYFFYSDCPPSYSQFYRPGAVSEMWVEEFEAIAARGGVTVLVLHPQLIGRPSRLRVLQDLIDAARSRGDVWFPKLKEVASLVLDENDHFGDLRVR